MKNAINYYYGIHVKDIHQKNNQYTIITEGEVYVLELCEFEAKQIKDIYELSLALHSQGIYCHQIVLNNEGNTVTNINNKIYVLMKVKVDLKKTIELNDIIAYTFKIREVDSLKNNDWRTLWMNKIDYFEYQINQLGLKYPLIRESSSYFIGIVENGIMLLSDIKNDDIYLSHRRISCHSTHFDLYNPFNIVFDTRVRNTAEYFKSVFMSEEKTGIMNYIETNQLTENELKLFFIRILYPSFYFDEFEYMLRLDKDDKKIKKIIDKIDSYQLLLAELYHYIGSRIMLPPIEWLKK